MIFSWCLGWCFLSRQHLRWNLGLVHIRAEFSQDRQPSLEFFEARTIWHEYIRREEFFYSKRAHVNFREIQNGERRRT